MTRTRRPLSHPVHMLLAAALLAGCGDTRPARQPEGTVALQGGAGQHLASESYVLPGPPFQRPGMLVPASQQAWKSAWVEPESKEHPLMQGVTAGMTTGVAILLITPLAATFWPAAVGIVVGSTAAGMLGAGLAESTDVRMSAPDRKVILETTEKLQPERLFREALVQALSRRATRPLAMIAWVPGDGPDTTARDPLTEVRDRRLDGVIECAVTALGLAAGEERDTFGVFVEVRVRALETHDGKVRYDRILAYGPGQPVAGLPRSEFHTVEFLAADQGRVFRQLASDAIRRLARVLAGDPKLPLAQ